MSVEERAFVVFYVSFTLALLVLLMALAGCSLLMG
jgi:hypothetical protein